MKIVYVDRWTDNVVRRAKEALTRAWEAESKLAGIADVLNQELRENGGDRFQISPRDDIGLAIRRLVDCVREKK